MGNGRIWRSRAVFGAVFAIVSCIAAGVRAEPQAFFGFDVQALSSEMAAALGLERADGAVIRDVILDGPAGRAGVRRGDVILGMAGQDIQTFQGFLALLDGLQPGRAVALTVLSEGVRRDLTLEAAPWPPSRRLTDSSSAEVPNLGLTLAAITPKIRAGFDLPWAATGVVATLVDRTKGVDLKRGDVIVRVNQKPVWLPSQVIEAYAGARAAGRASVLLLVGRDGAFRYVLLPVLGQ